MKRVKQLPNKTVAKDEFNQNREEMVKYAAEAGPVNVVNEDGSKYMSLTIKFPPLIDMCMQCCELHPQYCPSTGKYEYEDWESCLEDDDD